MTSIVDYCNLSFVKRFPRSLGGNVANFANFFNNTNAINDGIFFYFLQVFNRRKVVSKGGYICLIMGLFDESISLECKFVVVVCLTDLFICKFDGTWV